MLNYMELYLEGIMINSRNKYSDEEILEQLKEHYRKNSSISKRSFKADKNACSISTVSVRFGSWAKGLEKAGFGVKELKKYSDEDILDQLRDHYKRNPKITRSSFERDKTVCSSTIVHERFRGFDNALLKAGIPLQKITKEVIIRDLKDHYKRNGKITRKSFNEDKMVCSGSVVSKRFGNWRKGLEAAGIKEIEYVEYDREKLFKILKLKVKSGELKVKEDIKKIKGIPSIGYIEKHWDWKELFKNLGLEFRNHSYTDEEIIMKYKKVKNMRKYRKMKITSTKFEKETGVSFATIFNHFGSWNNFLKLMDEEILVEHSKVVHTNKELLIMYRDFSIKIGKSGTGATQDDVDESFTYKSSVLERRFGSINKMRELLGMEIRYPGHKKYTKEILTEKLLEKYKEYGRRITQKEMAKLREKEGFPGMSTFLSNFQTTKMTEIWAEVLRDKDGK